MKWLRNISKFWSKKAKSKSSLRPWSYTKFKDYIEITNVFQKDHEKLPQTAMNSFTLPWVWVALDIKIFETMQIRKLTVMRAPGRAIRYSPLNLLMIFSEISPYFQCKSLMFQSFFSYLTMDTAKHYKIYHFVVDRTKGRLWRAMFWTAEGDTS